jgi:predicted lipoprotein with Yx(FWY)xxD motif
MTSKPARFALRGTGMATAGLIAGLVLTACGSSGGGSPAGGGPSAGTNTHAGAQTVQMHSGPMGSYLTDKSGKTLYMFASDSATKSSCNSACLNYWPPLTGPAKAGSGVAAGKLGTITTAGKKQVTYAGHPLYLYTLDTKPGDTNGQGSTNFGAKWWIIAPSGKPITGASGGSGGSSSSSSAGGGGGGGWG